MTAVSSMSNTHTDRHLLTFKTKFKKAQWGITADTIIQHYQSSAYICLPFTADTKTFSKAKTLIILQCSVTLDRNLNAYEGAAHLSFMLKCLIFLSALTEDQCMKKTSTMAVHF